jgi:hypothetical protein
MVDFVACRESQRERFDHLDRRRIEAVESRLQLAELVTPRPVRVERAKNRPALECQLHAVERRAGGIEQVSEHQCRIAKPV